MLYEVITFQVVDQLRELTGLNLARAENLVDATQNADDFVEVSGILKAHAASLFKICSDLRLLGSGPDAGFAEIILPRRQAGSSIMPGKINPVIPEAVTQVARITSYNVCYTKLLRNFAPAKIHVPERVIVTNEDLYCSLAVLSQKMTRKLVESRSKGVSKS